MRAVDEAALRSEGFTVGQWRVEPRRQRIVHGDLEKRLDPRLIDVLIELASAGGEVVTRGQLLDMVWKDTHVSENTLSQAVSRLRRALEDSTSQPRFIETISKSGYRLLVPVGFELRKPGPVPQQAATGSQPGNVEPQSLSVPVRSWLLPWVVVGALALALVALGLGREAPEAPVAVVRPELTLVGNQFGPRISPAGDHVAFAWQAPDSTSSFDIWIQQIGGDSPVRVTNSPDPVRLPAWSPDGQRLAYVEVLQEQRECSLFAVHVVGGPAERLGECAEGQRSLAWSPDGRTLAHDGLSLDGSGVRALFLLEIASGKRTQLTSPPAGIVGDTGPRFSPDGRMLAFEREIGASRDDIAVIAVRGGEPRTLTKDAWGKVRGVDWASDGGSLLFASNRVGQYSLWRVPVAGGEPARVPILDAWVTQPSVSRAGGRLTYRTFRDAVDIWELPLDASGEARGEPVLRMPSTRSERQPTWSPRGDGIAFISDRSGSTELWSGHVDGSDLVRHTDLNGPLPASPAWSPDAKRILFDAAIDGDSDLFVVDRQSRRPQRLTTESSEERNGTFSRDGTQIYFASNRLDGWEVWRMPAIGGTALRVTTGGGFLAQESLDGRDLFYVRQEQPGIWTVPVVGGVPRQVLADLDLADWGSWVLATEGIYYLRRGPTTIGFANFDSTPTQVVFEPSKQMPYLSRDVSLSPDGRSLLFSMIDHSDDEVMTADLIGL